MASFELISFVELVQYFSQIHLAIKFKLKDLQK